MPNESNLVKRCQAGDERAFAELVDAHKVKVAGIVYRMIGRTESVEDIAQEVFLQVFRGIGGFRGEAALSTWIYRITYRICLREIDRQPCTGTDVSFDDDETSAEVLHSTGENTETCERLESVRQWLADLPDHYRWAVTLYYLQNKRATINRCGKRERATLTFLYRSPINNRPVGAGHGRRESP